MGWRLHPQSIHGELAWFVVVLALPLVALSAYLLYDRARHDVADAESVVRRLADNGAERAARFAEEARVTLETIARRPLVRAMDPARCDPDLRHLLDLYPRASNFLVVNREGRIICGAIPPPRDRVVRIRDEAVLRDVLANGRFALSQPVVGRIKQRWTVAAVQPVFGEDGAVSGSLSMSIDLVNWRPFPSVDGGPQDTIVTLLSGDTVIARSSDAEKWVGRDVSASAIMQRVRELKQGVVRARGAAEFERIWAFRPVPGTGWTVLAGIRTEHVMGPVQARTVNVALVVTLLVGMVIALAFGFARRLARPVDRIAQALRLRAEGRADLAIPVSGPREIAAVAEELNRGIQRREHAERTLRESEERFRALWETSADAILMLDEASVIRYANPAVLEVFGYRPEEVLGRDMALLQPAQLAAAHREGIARYLRTGERRLDWRSTLTTGRRKDGAEFPVEVSFSELRLGGRRYFAGFLSDVSEREELLARMQMQLERMPVACLLFDRELRINYANAAAERTFGWRREEMSGRLATELYVPAERRAVVLQIFERLRQGEYLAAAGPALRKDGSKVDLEWVNTPLTGRDGAFLGLMSMATDVTERLRAERELAGLARELEERVQRRTAELEAANSELEAFSYSVSHDLRAPLRHIGGFVRLLEKEVAAPSAKAAHYLDTISTAATRMGALIDDLLTLSRTGRQALTLRRVEPGALVGQLIREAAPEIGARQVEWSLGELPAVMADPELLRIVLQNLLSNALKYSRPRAVARIAVAGRAAGDGSVEISVRDNGVGFDPRFKDKLFGVFQRLHREEEFEGTGIGLATARRIVHRHGQRIWGEGEPDRGATFTFTMTAAEAMHESGAHTAG